MKISWGISNKMKKLAIAIVGMTGAGKSEAGSFFSEKGLPVLRFGSAVDDEIKKAGLKWSPENTAHFRKKIREDLGMAAPAIITLPKIKEAFENNTIVILDGLYSWEEYLYLKDKVEEIMLLCIYTRKSLRYDRLQNRVDRPFTPDESAKRDIHELEVINKGGPIAFADYVIKNEGTQEQFKRQLELFWEEVQR